MEVWNRDITRIKDHEMGNDPQSDYWKSQKLRLIYLSEPITLKVSAIDVDITTIQSEDMEVLHSVQPGIPTSLFIKFPFKSPADMIN